MITRSDLARAAAEAREVDLTTFGRATGRPSRRTIWITADASGRIHVRSGQGLSRDWPRNLLANPRAVLHINGRDIAVRARHVTDRTELRASHDALQQKYGWELPASQPGDALTPPEQATFELIAAEQ
jgi:deazaflavin-dependent oxidoreductase (nitroreductase family)